MLLRRTLFSIAVATVVSGCAVGPDYRRPATPLPDHYLGQPAAQAEQAADQVDLATWWSGFGDPQLNRYIALALERNLDLVQAAARVTQSRAGLGAANAALMPSGAVSAQAARAYQSVETPIGQVLSAQPDFDRYGNAHETNLGAGWELDLFGGLRRGREAALAEYQASAAGQAAARLAVAAQTADLYISIRGLQTRVEITRRQLQTQQQLLELLNLLHGKELIPELQVRQAEGALAQVHAAVPMLEAALEKTMNAFDVMLGVAPGTYRRELAEPRAIPSAPRLAAVGEPADLLRRRPDLIAAERRLAASNARIGMAIAEYYPKFSLTGTIGSATSVSGANLFSSGASQGAALLGLRWRLFDFGRIDAQIDLARGQEAEALAAYRLAVLRAAGDVENALSDLLKSDEQARALGKGEVSLGRARGAAFAAYQKGVVSLIEVLQADESLLRVTDARAQAQTGTARAAVAAFRALGGGWKVPDADALAQQ
jgi:NodT family efflux transporter outer membrane factor (OMF) lipoprotein